MSGRDALDYTKKFTTEQLLASIDLQRMFRAVVAEFGENARAVKREFRDDHPDVPWRLIGDLRNVVIHQYDDVNYRKLHDTITTEFPPVCARLERILDEEDPIDESEYPDV